MKTLLITGGARSGKSDLAQELARKSGQMVLFVATATAGDDEMRRRIEAHRKSRPGEWRTLEAATQVGSQIRENLDGAQTVIVDCITMLVSNVFGKHFDVSGQISDAALIEKDVIAEIHELIDCCNRTMASFIIVTNEVGLGLVPENAMGRLYRDLLGKANQLLAERADEVYFMVSGLPVRVKPVQP
ncbi:MAG: bifunctional adenosylcobinamide kinase/adenosylcobinamide-phosphate guanylyltransferase [Chloroflexi bacterium]|nr:bifunctional adenosylcobinamide kinase/adenosylcobinamide-phosphate guanylyltransferase [Chloroflexota bacterium]